jgi:AcrR family transcriptional regulator
MNIDYRFDEFPITTRDEQKLQTRMRILETALALIHRGGEEAVTIRAVASGAGITERTVFRHFRTRDALLLAAWRRLRELLGSPRLPRTIDALIDAPRIVFPRFDQVRRLMQAYIISGERRAGRRRPDKERQQVLVECIRQELEYLDVRSLRRRAAIADLLISPYAWQFLQETWGLSGKQAAKVAAEALTILLNRSIPY